MFFIGSHQPLIADKGSPSAPTIRRSHATRRITLYHISFVGRPISIQCAGQIQTKEVHSNTNAETAEELAAAAGKRLVLPDGPFVAVPTSSGARGRNANPRSALGPRFRFHLPTVKATIGQAVLPACVVSCSPGAPLGAKCATRSDLSNPFVRMW